jgi:hypothetical protein
MVRIDPKALILCIIFPILAILSVIARFWARSIQKAKLAADDWMIFPALMSDAPLEHNLRIEITKLSSS